MLVLAGGQLTWDQSDGRFDPGLSNAAPPALTDPKWLLAEPLYIDVSADAPWDVGSLAFRDKVTALATPIHGKPKDQLAGDDLREHRRFRRLRAAAVAGLAVLTVIAVVAAVIAVVKGRQATQREHEAIQQRNQAIAGQLVTDATNMLNQSKSGDDVRALQELLAAHAIAGHIADGGLLDGAVKRASTEKIIDTGTRVTIVASSSDGRLIASANTFVDDSVRLWDAHTGQSVGRELIASTGMPASLAFSPDGHHLAVGGRSGGVAVWDITDPTHVAAPRSLVGDPSWVQAVAFSPDGHRLAQAGNDDTIYFWDTDTGQLTTRTVVATVGNTQAVALSADLHRVATGDNNGTVQVWDADTGKPMASITYAHNGNIQTIAFSPDGHRIATGGTDKTIRLWNAETAQPIGGPLAGHTTPSWALENDMTGWPVSVAFSADGHRLAAGYQDSSLQIWNGDTGVPLTS